MNPFRVSARPAIAIAVGVLLASPTTARSLVQQAPAPGQRVVLVTGSTGGLGREIALALAAEGDHVIVHGRSEERGAALVREISSDLEGSARFYRADYASLDQVRALADDLLRDYSRIDVLVNNAGVLFADDPERHVSSDGYELTFQVNYLAPYLLTELLVPLMRRSAPTRIVTVASTSAAPLDFGNLMLERGYTGWGAYNQSKLAQVMHTIDLAAELDGSGVTVNALHPATLMDTGMVLSNSIEPMSSVMDGRDRVLQLVNGESIGTGAFYVNGEPSTARDPQAYDAEVRARLRQVTERLIAP